MLITFVVSAGCLGTSTETTIGAPAGTTADGSGGASMPLAEIEVPVAQPTATDVVTLGAGIDPGKAAPGATVTVAVRLRILEPWHIYAVNKPTGVSVPTKLELKLPAGVTKVGEWDIPKPKAYESDEEVFIYAKDVVFRHQVKVADDASGLLNIKCDVKYQPCNNDSCKPPTSGVASVALEVGE